MRDHSLFQLRPRGPLVRHLNKQLQGSRPRITPRLICTAQHPQYSWQYAEREYCLCVGPVVGHAVLQQRERFPVGRYDAVQAHNGQYSMQYSGRARQYKSMRNMWWRSRVWDIWRYE